MDPENIHSDKGTEAESFIYSLSKDKLLEEYCILNPFILDSDKKEVCDLIIFGTKTCLLISIKNYAHSGNDDRFRKKVFEKSKDQLFGAKRRLLLEKTVILVGKNNRQTKLIVEEKTFILITINFGHELEAYEA